MTVTSTRPTTQTGSVSKRFQISKKTAFLGVFLLGFAVYTEMAFAMEWQTVAGRVGPGFFPRIVGILAMVVIVTAIVRDVRSDVHEEATPALEEGEVDLGRHPVAVGALVLAGVFLVFTFGLLGAVISPAVFLVATLWYLDREHPVRAVLVGLLFPLAMYLAFQTGLNAGLPSGILPLP